MNGLCRHNIHSLQCGVVLAAVGNSLRGDDGIASVLCDSLPDKVLRSICRFDVGTYISLLGDCVSNHKAAVIVDSTRNGAPVGTALIVDLLPVLDKHVPRASGSVHTLSLVDELRLAKINRKLPERLVLFAVEVGRSGWDSALSAELRKALPGLVGKLSLLLSEVSDTVNSHA